MKTNIEKRFLDTRAGQEANDILRACVHCGFCTATCPTYQLLGDELDSPRGRIYLIKEILEGKAPSAATQRHLDRCLTCRSCESTCPSGVKYGRLVDIGRDIVEKNVPRPLIDRIKRDALNAVIPKRTIFRSLLTVGKIVKPLLPNTLQKKIPATEKIKYSWPNRVHERKMLLLDGCVQPALAPNINIATARILDRIGISLVPISSVECCGAVTYHLNKQKESLAQIKNNIDLWWPAIEDGAEAIVITASGCGTMVKEYGHILSDDPRYAEKAKTVSAITMDLSEVIQKESNHIEQHVFQTVKQNPNRLKRVAFHSPCSLQHGQQIKGVIEGFLVATGFTLTTIEDPHLCCGSAGTYSLLQTEISADLLKNKISSIEKGDPQIILTANIGCLTQLQSGTQVSVMHWAQFLEESLAN